MPSSLLPSTPGFPCLQQALHSEEEHTQTSDSQHKGHLFTPRDKEVGIGGGSASGWGPAGVSAGVDLREKGEAWAGDLASPD